MSMAMLGEIRLFAGNFAPRNWTFCQGQILSISSNTALFSILGTTYGGNGTTTFALPDLRGRAPIGPGQGPGLSTYVLGQTSGVETVTLLQSQMPLHTHTLTPSPNASSRFADVSSPAGAVPATSPEAPLYSSEAPDVTTAGGANIAVAGGSQPHENRSPSLVLNYIICTAGIYPSRN
jgi:microcystin-dependent protein